MTPELKNTPSGHDIDTDRIEDLRDILSETKIRLLQQILASQTGALSAVELAARNTITESTIRDHLRELSDRDNPVIRTLEPETDGPVPNGIPRKYYAVTEYGIDLLKQVGMYEQIGVLYDVYESADLRLPDPEDHPVDIEDIEEYPHRPVPDWL
jgi:predicted ArsR family transcriptional regulator